MQKKPFLWVVIACLLLLCGCSAQRELFAMDTVITMQVSGHQAEKALDLAAAEIYRLDQMLSIGDKDSEIASLNLGIAQTVSDETAALLETALSLSEVTGGAYDCTIAPAANAWGWYGDSPAVPDQELLEAALLKVGFQSISIEDGVVSFEKAGMGIDLGGIGKGYAAGKLYSLLTGMGIRSGILSLGGNVRAIGSKPNGQPWIVGIADPEHPSSYLGTVAVSDCAVVTSGDYQRFFTENEAFYHHILDPKTGFPADNGLRSVTIICRDDTMADGLSTALFVMGLEDAITFWRSGTVDFEAVFVADDQIYLTEGLNDIFQCTREYEVISR